MAPSMELVYMCMDRAHRNSLHNAALSDGLVIASQTVANNMMGLLSCGRYNGINTAAFASSDMQGSAHQGVLSQSTAG